MVAYFLVTSSILQQVLGQEPGPQHPLPAMHAWYRPSNPGAGEGERSLRPTNRTHQEQSFCNPGPG